MSAPDDGTAELVTLVCEVCNEPITGPAKGKGSAIWKLGRHKWSKHRMSNKNGGPVSKAEAADVEAGERGALGVVYSMRDAIGTRRAGTPNADELTAGLGRGLGLVTLAAASWAVETDPGFGQGEQADRARDQQMERLVLSDKAAREVMAPLGRMMAPTKLNQRFGRAAVDNVDAIGSLCELAILTMSWRRYWHERERGRLALEPWSPELGAGVPGPVIQDGMMTTPPPTAGQVMSFEDVARLRAAQT